MTWTLNGTHIGEFRGLTQKHIDSLRYVGNVYGCEVFESHELPAGTAELWCAGQRVAVIRGLA